MNGLVIDLFAGGGGASLGVERALGRPIDIAVNHDWDALRNHNLNHPEAQHLVEDITEIVPLVVTGGQPVDVLWASPDCRHFSRAKGGKPCHPKIRSLPWQIVRWAREVAPALICMENVPEFLSWGPLDPETHRPLSDAKGETFAEWVQELRNEGYSVDWKVLKACDYGTPTSRKRLFLVARLDGQEVSWPEPTHGEGEGLLPYATAAECIDWSDLGKSVFGRKRPLADATCRRIARGLVKFVIEAKQPFVVGVGGRAGQSLETGVEQPLGTITTKNDRALVCPTLVQTGYGERAGQKPRCLDLQKPLGTIVAGGAKHALVTGCLTKFYGTTKGGQDLEEPLGTITALAGGGHHGLVTAWIAKHYGGVTGHGVERPLGTITATDSHGMGFGVTGGDQEGAERCAAFITTYYGQSVGRSADEPLATITTKERHGLVVVVIDGEEHVITDIRLRMLQPHELKKAQGFPESYRLEGTKRLQTRLIGNSVPPQLSEAVVASNVAPRARFRFVA